MLKSASSLHYFSLFDYVAWGDSIRARNSRIHKANVKAGRKEIIEKLLSHLPLARNDEFDLFLNAEVSLVPIPRSSLLTEGGVWPPLVISTVLLEMGYANQVLKILKRVTPLVQSSSKVAAEDRNSVEEHYKSLEVMNILNVSRQITLVDDFVTQGRTAYACYMRICEKYPDSEIRLFSLFGTYSTFGHAEESEKTTLFNPTFDFISYNARSGKTIRHTKYTD